LLSATVRLAPTLEVTKWGDPSSLRTLGPAQAQ
jgi:hypothetical protein